MKVRVNYQGRDVEGDEVAWDEVTPTRWLEVRGPDGVTVKILPALKRLIRLDITNEDGMPVYVVDMLEPAVVTQFQKLIV
jgi:hypothetical protein